MYGGTIGRGSTTSEEGIIPAEQTQRNRNLIDNRLEDLRFASGPDKVQIGKASVSMALGDAVGFVVTHDGTSITCHTLAEVTTYLRRLLSCE